jgi:hypothetical protein
MTEIEAFRLDLIEVICLAAQMTVFAYMLKDRIKVWGTRYLGTIAKWLGIFLPDHVSDLYSHDMQKVCRQVPIANRHTLNAFAASAQASCVPMAHDVSHSRDALRMRMHVNSDFACLVCHIGS